MYKLLVVNDFTTLSARIIRNLFNLFQPSAALHKETSHIPAGNSCSKLTKETLEQGVKYVNHFWVVVLYVY